MNSVQERLFAATDYRRTAAVPADGRSVLAQLGVQSGGRVRVPAGLAVAPSRGPASVVVVPVARAQGAVPADSHRQPIVAGRRSGSRGRFGADVVLRTAQPVVQGVVRLQPGTRVTGPRQCRRRRRF